MLISKGNSVDTGMLGTSRGILAKNQFNILQKNSLLSQGLLLSECRPSSS